MRPSRYNELRRMRPELAITYATLLGGVIEEHPRRPDRWICFEESQRQSLWSSWHPFTEPSRVSAAIMFLARKGYVLTDDCVLLGPDPSAHS